MAFQPLLRSGKDLELEVLDRWREEDLFRRTLEVTKDGDPFVFYEGPPTANGRPGIHHVFARTIKDLICRYQTMLGRSVTRIAGWDTHGLPVEIEVEKALNLTGKADIEAFGVAEFNARCKESVFTYRSDWEQLSERIGYWLDYTKPYVTYSNEYVESVWWLLKQLADKDLLYEGHKVLPYCPRCGTALSSHELAMGYAEHKSPSIYALFRVVGDEPRYLLVWTTTPWTLPSNVAIAVNPAFTYFELDVDGKRIIVEQSIAERLAVPGGTHGEPLATFPKLGEYSGAELVGWRYEQLLDAVEVDRERAFRVVAGDFVTNEDGSGLVHMAPAFGADDYATIQREGMAFVNPVDESGRFTDTRWEVINGKAVFEANPVIAERLESEGKIFGRYQPTGYEHTYPFCWRCDSPLIYYARKSWFVRTTAFADRMIAYNRNVNWYPPEVGEGRFGEWLEGNVDWALSRDRYWGTPLPVWVCDANDVHRVVIGSYGELAECWGRPLPDDFDPHKPFIDDYTFACTAEGCDGTMTRVVSVIDAWFDSGAMPVAQWHYPFENEAEFGCHFPADYICEGLDQTRGWFYSLLAIATGVFDSPAYRNVIVNGLVLDKDGRKMSKRVGNVVDPWEAVDEFGADAIRVYLLASSQVSQDKLFDPRHIPEVARGFLKTLQSTYGFFALYAEDWTPDRSPPVEERRLIDQWLASRLDGLVRTVRAEWSDYGVTSGTKAIIAFCDNELSNWYVRVNRARFWAPDTEPDRAALATLYEALVTVTRLLAPVAPFVSDAMHRNLTGASVHVAGFPEEQGRLDAAMNEAMDVARRLASLARAARDSARINVRQPLRTMRVAVPLAVRGDRFDAFLEVVRREVNVKAIEIVDSDADLVRLKPKPNYRAIGAKHGKRTPAIAKTSEELEPIQLQQLERGESVIHRSSDGLVVEFQPDDITIQREVITDWLVQSDGAVVVALDPALDDELRAEGTAREIVNRVQRLRKEAGYDYNTRIAISLSGSEDVVGAAGTHEKFIAGETLARAVTLGKDLERYDIQDSDEIDGRAVVISLRRFDDLPGNEANTIGMN
jgi:isoleucyl-tRNA synthetase